MERLVELVNAWHKFHQGNPDGSISDFCRMYLVDKERDEYKETDPAVLKKPLPARISKGISRISKYLNFYIKRAGMEYNLENREDFQFLMNLEHLVTPSKTELIHATITDFTSGVEVIKRLKKRGFVEEYGDEQDKRAKRIKMTPFGKQALDTVYAKVIKMSTCAYKPLSEDEQKLLMFLLQKLDKFHTELYQQNKNKSNEEIFESLNCLL